jgi:hypothetical protein
MEFKEPHFENGKKFSMTETDFVLKSKMPRKISQLTFWF